MFIDADILFFFRNLKMIRTPSKQIKYVFLKKLKFNYLPPAIFYTTRLNIYSIKTNI